MNDTPPPDDPSVSRPDVDPGDPIAELAGFQEVPESEFLNKLVRRIERRVLSVDVLEFARQGMRELFLEYWKFITSFVKSDGKDNGGRSK